MVRVWSFAVVAGGFAHGLQISASLPLDAQFEQWAAHHERSFRDAAERSKRFALFVATAEKVHAHNALHDAGRSTYRQGFNALSAHTKEEFRARLGFRPLPIPGRTPRLEETAAHSSG